VRRWHTSIAPTLGPAPHQRAAWDAGMIGPSHRVADDLLDGHPATTLISVSAAIEATFVPSVGMLGCSLRHRGEELLGQRGGLAKYAASGSTMGIPLLHPWANRLGAQHYTVGTRHVALDPASPLVHRDAKGLPMHGLLGAYRGWGVTAKTADDTAARLSAQVDFAADPSLLAAFPFPHTLHIDVELRVSTLIIATTLEATGNVAVPVSFGYHPYLRLPGVPRAEWYVALPVRRQWRLDDRGIPTGRTDPVMIARGPLGDRTFDALFSDLARPARFVLAGGGRRITVEFTEGYDYTQIYAPADDTVICFEPMTAPTNALIAAGPALSLVPPGQRYSAVFRLTISDEWTLKGKTVHHLLLHLMHLRIARLLVRVMPADHTAAGRSQLGPAGGVDDRLQVFADSCRIQTKNVADVAEGERPIRGLSPDPLASLGELSSTVTAARLGIADDAVDGIFEHGCCQTQLGHG
jgi:aldose 1-epimerase